VEVIYSGGSAMRRSF